MWDISDETFTEWYRGPVDWNGQYTKSLNTTVWLRRRIMWLDTRKLVNLVRKLDPNSYAQTLQMSKIDVDNWCTGAVTSYENTDLLRLKCSELGTSGILRDDVRKSVEELQIRLPETYLQVLQVDAENLEAWKNGRRGTTAKLSGFILTNHLRLAIAKSLRPATPQVPSQSLT